MVVGAVPGLGSLLGVEGTQSGYIGKEIEDIFSVLHIPDSWDKYVQACFIKTPVISIFEQFFGKRGKMKSEGEDLEAASENRIASNRPFYSASGPFSLS